MIFSEMLKLFPTIVVNIICASNAPNSKLRIKVSLGFCTWGIQVFVSCSFASPTLCSIVNLLLAVVIWGFASWSWTSSTIFMILYPFPVFFHVWFCPNLLLGFHRIFRIMSGVLLNLSMPIRKSFLWHSNEGVVCVTRFCLAAFPDCFPLYDIFLYYLILSLIYVIFFLSIALGGPPFCCFIIHSFIEIATIISFSIDNM